MIALENRMILLETSNTMQHNNREAADVIQYEEYDLPLRNMQMLQRLEGLLRDSSCADKTVKI